MKTRKQKINGPNKPLAGFKETIEAERELSAKPEEDASGYRPNSKIQIPLKEDGTIDIDSMRTVTKDRLKQAIGSTPELQPQRTDGSQPQIFPPQVVWAIYGALGAIEAMLAQNMGKVPKEIADRVFTYTPQELELLTPPTVRVLSKYAADWMIKYQDEIALAGLLTTITIAKVNASLMLSKQAQNVVEMPKKEGVDPEIKPN